MAKCPALEAHDEGVEITRGAQGGGGRTSVVITQELGHVASPRSKRHHTDGKSKRAARKDLFSANCLPILMRLRSSKLGSGGLGIWATMRAISDENASETCNNRADLKWASRGWAARVRTGEKRGQAPLAARKHIASLVSSSPLQPCANPVC